MGCLNGKPRVPEARTEDNTGKQANASTTDDLIRSGKELGLEGESLIQFVENEKKAAHERDEREMKRRENSEPRDHEEKMILHQIERVEVECIKAENPEGKLMTMPKPVNGDTVKLWSLMSNQGDGLIAAGPGGSIMGNGLLKDNPENITANFQWHICGPSTSGKNEPKSTTKKPGLDGVTLHIKGNQIGLNSDEPYYITAYGDNQVKLINSQEYKQLDINYISIRTFRMEAWPSSTLVPNPGSYVRFRLYENKFLGCNGAGKVSVMEQEEPAKSSWGDNYYPNPGTLFYLYDLGPNDAENVQIVVALEM